MNRLEVGISCYKQLPPNTTPRARGVRYFVPIELYKAYWGAMNTVKEGRRYKKHIVVRRMPYAKGLLQLYTYHVPKTWSATCVENREIIKLAQRRAHALEHDHSYAGIEWRIRFFKHYYRVFKGGAAPEPGMKRYSRFYQYVYVAIYRELKQLQAQANEPRQTQPTSSDVSFEPIDALSYFRQHRPASAMTYVLTKKRGASSQRNGKSGLRLEGLVRGSTSFEGLHTHAVPSALS